MSEKILLDQFVRAESGWYVTEDTDEISISKSKKVTVSSEAEVAKGLKMKISVEVSETLGSKHKPNPKKGDLCRIAVRCDYVEVSFIRYTYNQNGKQIGKKNMKVKIPIEGTAVKYLEYD